MMIPIYFLLLLSAAVIWDGTILQIFFVAITAIEALGLSLVTLGYSVERIRAIRFAVIGTETMMVIFLVGGAAGDGINEIIFGMACAVGTAYRWIRDHEDTSHKLPDQYTHCKDINEQLISLGDWALMGGLFVAIYGDPWMALFLGVYGWGSFMIERHYENQAQRRRYATWRILLLTVLGITRYLDGVWVG